MSEIYTIYELFTWSDDYSEDEYNKSMEQGIKIAANIINLIPFIQPIIFPLEKSKSVWEGCAKVISLRSDNELIPYLNLLFEWLQDMNWPGSWIIFDRLAKIPYEKIKDEFTQSVDRAKTDDNQLWLMALNDFKKAIENIDSAK